MIILTKEEKQKNTELLKKAIGSRTSKEFSELIGVSPSTLCILLKQKYTKRLPMEIIRAVDFYKANKLDQTMLKEFYKNNHYERYKTTESKEIIAAQLIGTIVDKQIVVGKNENFKNEENIFSKFLNPDINLNLNIKNESKHWIFFILNSNSLEDILSKTIFLFYNVEKNDIDKISFIFTDQNLMNEVLNLYANMSISYKNISMLLFDKTNLNFKEEFLKITNKSDKINKIFKSKKKEGETICL